MKIFLDTCIWFAGIHSENGGSAKIFSESEKRNFEIVATEDLIEEIGSVILRKLGNKGLLKLGEFLKKPNVVIYPKTTASERKAWVEVTVEKDCLALAGALKCKAEIIVTPAGAVWAENGV